MKSDPRKESGYAKLGKPFCCCCYCRGSWQKRCTSPLLTGLFALETAFATCLHFLKFTCISGMRCGTAGWVDRMAKPLFQLTRHPQIGDRLPEYAVTVVFTNLFRRDFMALGEHV